MNCLFILNDAPYANERAYNALRLATALTSDPDRTVRIFFTGEGAWCAVANHTVPQGQHDIEWMLKRFLAGLREVAVCATCMDARSISAAMLIEGIRASSMDELAVWTVEADRVLVF
jgi:uncharacterized protein involved in oxidation of intracellular sulfur